MKQSHFSVKNHSVVRGGILEIALPIYECAGFVSASVDLYFTGAHEEEFSFGAGTPIQLRGGKAVLHVSVPTEARFGAYLVGGITLLGYEGPGGELRLSSSNPMEALVEVRPEFAKPSHREELLANYLSLCNQREVRFRSGIGLAATVPGVKTFTCFIMIKNCLITRPMRLGQFEILPFGGLDCEDEASALQTLVDRAYPGIKIDFAISKQHALQAQPLAVLHFPLVRAASVEQAGAIAHQEAVLVADIVSMRRGGYAAIIGSLIADHATNTLFHRIDNHHYRGNLLGGEISGENPDVIRAQFNVVKTDPKTQLYVSLFRDALEEERVEFAYFRYWSLLEAMARDANLQSKPRYNWDGSPTLDKNGNPTLVGSNARDLVAEFLRQMIGGNVPDIGHNSFGLVHVSIDNLITIWYRHRNCTAHTGGCRSDDPNQCKRTSTSYSVCRSAHEEIVKQSGQRNLFSDSYLRELRELVYLAISRRIAAMASKL